ncbi:MAG: ribulose-phosphate 3-epimerase [Clostridia bacterium]|nr:ribulose-phosphate 3-epimerase [Clostridia bacterium]
MAKVLPSILTGDFMNLPSEVDIFKQEGLDEVHIDVMDGNFVPQITFGSKFLKDLKAKWPDMKYDTHLMINNASKYAEEFLLSGATSIIAHIENNSVKELLAIKKLCKKHNADFGISLNPKTKVSKLKKALFYTSPEIILIMSVNPGFGGQNFIESTLDKAEELKKIKEKKNYHYTLEIDGGVNEFNFKHIKDRGIERIVVGSGIYKDGDIKNNVIKFKGLDK